MEPLVRISQAIDPFILWVMAGTAVIVVLVHLVQLVRKPVPSGDGLATTTGQQRAPQRPFDWFALLSACCLWFQLGIMPAIHKVYEVRYWWDAVLIALVIAFTIVSESRRRRRERREAIARGESPPAGSEIPFEAGAAFFAAMGVIGLLLLAYFLLWLF